MVTLKGWYASADYQALVPLCDAAANMSIIAYNEPA